jgi:Flp pilus assembly protein TadB
MEFTTSVGEMARRLRAYTTLIVSLLAGVAVSSVDFLLSAPLAWLACIGGLALALVLSRLALVRSRQQRQGIFLG